MYNFFHNFVRTTFRVKHVVLAALVTTIYVFSGPFGTYEQMDMSERLVFWAPQGIIAFVVGGVACAIARFIYPTDHRALHGLLSAFVFAILFAPLNYMFIRNEYLGPAEFYMPFWQVLLLNFTFASILVAWILLNSPEEDALADQLPRLYLRLPEGVTGKISHITVEDYYTVVFLEDGTQHRLLMRFADAVKEMDETLGPCTHRSHWVAMAFVKEGKRVGNKEFVELACGVEVPVSKTYRGNLVAAGFFQEA